MKSFFLRDGQEKSQEWMIVNHVFPCFHFEIEFTSIEHRTRYEFDDTLFPYTLSIVVYCSSEVIWTSGHLRENFKFVRTWFWISSIVTRLDILRLLGDLRHVFFYPLHLSESDLTSLLNPEIIVMSLSRCHRSDSVLSAISLLIGRNLNVSWRWKIRKTVLQKM